jgi:hypothetical protein
MSQPNILSELSLILRNKVEAKILEATPGLVALLNKGLRLLMLSEERVEGGLKRSSAPEWTASPVV